MPSTPRALRDHGMVAMLIGCGLRRAELLALTLASVQQREEHWVIADLVGKGAHVRSTLRLRDLVNGSRSRDAPHLDRLLARAPALRPGKASPRRREGGPVVSLRRIACDYGDAGSVNALIALWGFVDDTVFIFSRPLSSLVISRRIPLGV
jgi:integrase